ncbi:hypothetical protein SMC26_14455 [Actinomadura fulvescens]|uniref:Uncharacterized protein n=1 Tax=Actinomadura fulvescens TaxID=46160 RepID=A0ABP6CEQ5_9ACTN
MREPDGRHGTANELAVELARLRAVAPLDNPLLELAQNGLVTPSHLRNLVLIEERYHGAELVAYGTLLSRFPHSPASDFIIAVARVVQDARTRLATVAESLDTEPDAEPDAERRACSPTLSGIRRDITAHGFCSYVSWLALNGSQAAMGLALYSDPDGIYYGGSRALVNGLRERGYELPDPFVEYYTGTPSKQQNDEALAVAQAGLDNGDDPVAALDAGRLCDQYMALLWKAAAGSYDDTP